MATRRTRRDPTVAISSEVWREATLFIRDTQEIRHLATPVRMLGRRGQPATKVCSTLIFSVAILLPASRVDAQGGAPTIVQFSFSNPGARSLGFGGAFVALPVAWITGGNLLDKAAALLFKITGQAAEIQDQKIIQAFQAAGFETRVERRQLSTSLLLIVHAQKP